MEEEGGKGMIVQIYRNVESQTPSRSRTTDSGRWGEKGRELVDEPTVDDHARRPGCTNWKEKIPSER